MAINITVTTPAPINISVGYSTATTAYFRKLILLFRNSLVAYWPLSDTSGSAALDVAGSNRNGVYHSTTLAATTSPAGLPAPQFITGDVTINDTAQITAVFNGAEGAVGGWAKLTNAGVWTDGVQRDAVALFVDGNNYITITKNSGNNTFFMTLVKGGTTYLTWFPLSNTGWFHWVVTWSEANSRITWYINGVPGNQLPTATTWSGNLTVDSMIGSLFGTFVWDGFISDVFLLNREMTAAEAKQAGTAGTQALRMSVIGDSISVREGSYGAYPFRVMASLNSGNVGVHDVAVGAYNILSNFISQTALIANDDADIIIIALGTGDAETGDMNALKAVLRTGIDNLKISNPRASIYYLNVLPRWTDVGGLTPVLVPNIRAAISTVCTEKNVTCWDTFTTPWITPADTVDGLHPNAAGHAKISAQVLTRLT